MLNPEHQLTPAEAEEVDYGQHLLWRMVNATIKQFGANDRGEIFLSVEKDGVATEVIVGLDEHKEICLFEVEKKEVPA